MAGSTSNISKDANLLDNTGTPYSSSNRLPVDAVLSASNTFPTITRQDAALAARTTSGNSGALESSGFGCLTYNLIITAASGTTPTLQISLQSSEDGVNFSEFINTPQFTTTGSFRHQRIALGAKYYRFAWTITGGSPSFTFSIDTTLKAYLPARSVTVSKYADVDLTTNGNVSTTFSAADCKNVTLMTFRAADGGSNSQWVVDGSNNSMNWDALTGNISQGAGTTQTQSFSELAFRFYRIRVTSASNVGTRVLDVFWAANA